MNQAAHDANEDIARHAAASRQDQQIKLLEEIRNLLMAIYGDLLKTILKDLQKERGE
jgi:hypothetical protein